MRLPDFIMIGAAKAGTTSIYSALSHHPDIYFSPQKEPEFFARDDRYNPELEGYLPLFSGARPHQMAGEASTVYSLAPHLPETARRIKKHLPDVKLIYTIRNPIKRTYSYYTEILKHYRNATNDMVVHRSFEDFIIPDRHAVAAPREKAFASFDAFLPDVPDLCIAGSSYVRQIKMYLKEFPREQLHVLKFEDFVANPEAELRKITDFLGVSPMASNLLDAAATRKNVSSDFYKKSSDDARMGNVGARMGPIWKLRSLLPESTRQRLKPALLRFLPGGQGADIGAPPPMLESTKEMLRAKFVKDIPELETLTGLDFSDWNLSPNH